MKKLLLLSASAFLFTMPAMASGTHEGGHDSKDKMMTAGQPGKAADVKRTIKIEMLETEDGKMLFKPASVKVEKGETIRFTVVNIGELEHEFVLDTHKGVIKHKAVMEKFPEMEHDDPNSVRLEAGKKGDIYWNFSIAGNFQFACLIPGHFEAGMKGDLTVSDVNASSDASDVEFTKGVIKKVAMKTGKVTIKHGELKNLDMPSMTMIFRTIDKPMLEKLKAGSNIEFIAERVNGKLTIVKLK